MAHRRDTASAAYNQSPPSPGYGVRDSIEGWIESLEFDVSLSTQLWANFLLNCWPVSDTGQPAHLPARISSTQGKGNSLDLRRAPQSMSASLWRQVDRWVNEGGASGEQARTQATTDVHLRRRSTMAALAIESTDLELVRTLERRRIEATRANDTKALEPLLHDQLIYVNSVGEVYDKVAYLRHIQTHSLTYDADFDVRESQVRLLDDTIILAGVMLGHARLEREQQVFHFRSIGVWRKDAGQWRLLAWQSSSAS